MCLAVYIATPKEIETSTFVENETYFYCEKEKNIEKLKERFSYQNIYYCGAYTGCSCGFNFNFDEEDDEEDKNENVWGKQSLEEMFLFFRNYINELNEIEMFVCWEGDEDSEAETNKIIKLSNFEFGRAFDFNQREFVKIIK